MDMQSGFAGGSDVIEAERPGGSARLNAAPWAPPLVVPTPGARAVPPAPRVTVVIPVRDRRTLLGRTLDALDAQTFRDFEVVVADDGSSDGSGEMAGARRVAGRWVTVVRTDRAGAVLARLNGVERSSAEILAFTDSDCEPAPNWLAAAVAAIDDGAELAHGPTEPTGPVRLLERSLWSTTEGLYPSCNLVMRRASYDAVGGFELRHGERGSGEDTVLAWRVRRSGDARYIEEAVVRHSVLPFDVRDALRRTWDGRDFPALAKEVPELRDTSLFQRRVFLGGYHRVPMYATLLTLVTGRRRWALVPAALWAHSKWRQFDGRQGTKVDRLKALPVELALDVVFGAALLSGSVRERSLVL
jgi:glycosyltransferase involved in cell wall biosynthesis